jgi:hypothetical protein
MDEKGEKLFSRRKKAIHIWVSKDVTIVGIKKKKKKLVKVSLAIIFFFTFSRFRRM